MSRWTQLSTIKTCFGLKIKYNKKINLIIDCTTDDNYNLVLYFNERILKNVLHFCSDLNNRYSSCNINMEHKSPWTVYLWNKAKIANKSVQTILRENLNNSELNIKINELANRLRYDLKGKHEFCTELSDERYRQIYDKIDEELHKGNVSTFGHVSKNVHKMNYHIKVIFITLLIIHGKIICDGNKV